jgi:hypothetical protein
MTVALELLNSGPCIQSDFPCSFLGVLRFVISARVSMAHAMGDS